MSGQFAEDMSFLYVPNRYILQFCNYDLKNIFSYAGGIAGKITMSGSRSGTFQTEISQQIDGATLS